MKTKSLLHLFLGLLFYPVLLMASEGDVTDIVARNLATADIGNHLESATPVYQTGKVHRKLKPLTAFGRQLDGRASFKGDSLESLSLWTSEFRLAPKEASRLFTQLSEKLEGRLGKGKLIKDVPNFGDASEVKTDVMLWNKDNEVIILEIHAYPSRAGVSLVHESRSSWLEEMGADERKFWNKTLESSGGN